MGDLHGQENIRNGTVDRPMAIFCTDADTGSRKGLVEVGRMVDVLMANPGVAALSTSIRVGNFSLLNPLTMTQVIDYSIIKYGFGGQSFWRSTQACIGMAVMYNYELLVQKPEHGGQSVLERYTKPFSESFFELVTLDMVEDQGMSVFCIEAGLGCMFSHSTNFYTYVPDTIDEFFGQRRRWIEGWIVGPTHFYFCSTGFFTMRFWRFPYWLATCWTQFYVLGLMPALMVSTTATLMGTKWPITNQCRPDMLAAVSADNLPCACSSFYLGWLQNMTAHGITGIYLENERLPGCGASWPRCDNVCSSDLGDSLFLQANGYNVTFYGMWAFMLLFCFHAMDTTPKGWLMTTTDAQGQSRTWFSWLHLYCGITFCFTIFFWVIMIDLVHQSNPYGLNEYVSLYGVNLGDTDSPVLAWSMSFVATLVFYLILHEPCYWFQVVCGFISSCFTGAICGGTPSIQNPLVILYTFANLDSTNWGTRATADHGLYAGGDQDTTAYKTSLWWTKVGLTTLWLSLNVVVSFLCVYSYILWGDYLGPEIYGYPWLSWPAFFATYAILGGRYLDWAVGRLILFHRERARQMPQEDALGGFLGTLLGLRVMSCELPCHRDLRGTHCDTSAFKAEVGTTQARVARWSWDADRAPGALGEKDNYSLKATSSYGSYDNIADGNSSRNKTSPGVDVELGDQMAARPASPL